MLHELRVENLLLIERAELRLGPGLNVLTGETGAGKTVLAHALDLLLGGKARPGIVRPGAAEAYVEGVFALPEALRGELGERLPSDADEVVLARRVSAEGRTRAYVAGRAATVADLVEIGSALLSFYGQHEHRKLMLAGSQLEILDGFCGPPQAARRASFAAAYGLERSLAAELASLRDRAGARERELDLLEWELAEIDEAEPSEEEETGLLGERGRLRHAEALSGAAGGGLGALDGDGEGVSGALALIASGARSLETVTGVDPALDELAARFVSLSVEADDLAGELRRYGEGIDGEPGRLQLVEERLAAFDRLKRKHGGTIEAVLAHAADCRERRDALAGAEEAAEGVEGRLAELRLDLRSQSEALRAARVEAAEGLSVVVRERLAELAMEGATFEVAFSDRDGWGPTGADEVEFLIAPNPGVPAGPLRDTASGGELSRIMLALMSAAAAESGPVTLVFDEVDAGIGGLTARAVGEQLRALAADRQVICITHLPQIASLADAHFRIAKDTTAETALTTVTALAAKDVVGEIVRMLGAEETDVAARRHAKELLRAA